MVVLWSTNKPIVRTYPKSVAFWLMPTKYDKAVEVSEEAVKSVNPNMDKVTGHKAIAGDGAVVMVNLMRLKNRDDGPRFLAELRQVVGSMLEDVGGENIYTGSAGPEFIGDDEWDIVILARYPDFEAISRLAENPVWQDQAAAIREKYLADARMFVTTSFAG